MQNKPFQNIRVAFIGTAGVPNRYGGFESFLENCGPCFAEMTHTTIVTCDAALYPDDKSVNFRGVRRFFINTRANGVSSIFHDLLAFFKVYRLSTHIMVLGVSGGIWFPLFRLMCRIGGKKLGVNIDGVEWRRGKFSKLNKIILRILDLIAQRFSDFIIYDNRGLLEFILPEFRNKAMEIGYSGDHVIRLSSIKKVQSTALTVCRIEPENNLDLLIKGALASDLKQYTIVGNWNHSIYSRSLRERFKHETRLQLLDPVYEPNQLAELRESCQIYLHGHSVGGTNPSLVEMLYYDCDLLCFDVSYNRVTAEKCASYFLDEYELTTAINLINAGMLPCDMSIRVNIREKYTANAIATAYLKTMLG